MQVIENIKSRLPHSKSEGQAKSDGSKAPKKATSEPGLQPHPLKDDAGTSDLDEPHTLSSPADGVQTPSPKPQKPSASNREAPTPWPLRNSPASDQLEAEPAALKSAKADTLVLLSAAVEGSNAPEEKQQLPVEVYYAAKEEQSEKEEVEERAASEVLSLQNDLEAAAAVEKGLETQEIPVENGNIDGTAVKGPENGHAEGFLEAPVGHAAITAWLAGIDEHAEAAELEAAQLRREAAEVEFHAQVLENRRRALLRESQEMAELGYKKKAQADALAVKIAADLEQLATLEAKAAQTVGIEDLPQHIKECEAEIGALSRRIAELKAEILWARGEIEHRVKEGDEWERLLSHRRSRVNRLKVQEAELREQEVFAHARAVEAARDAHEPAAWAKVKAEEAAALKAVIGDSSPADSEEESSSSVESAK